MLYATVSTLSSQMRSQPLVAMDATQSWPAHVEVQMSGIPEPMTVPGEAQGLDSEPNPLRRQALLVEYDLCQRDADQQASGFWTLAGLIASGSLISLGLVVGLASHEKGAVIAGGGSVLVSVALWLAQKRYSRLVFMRRLFFARQRVIEKELGLRKSHYVQAFLDAKNEAEALQGLTDNERRILSGLWETRGGNWHSVLSLDWLARLLGVAWWLSFVYHLFYLIV